MKKQLEIRQSRPALKGGDVCRAQCLTESGGLGKLKGIVGLHPLPGFALFFQSAW